MSVGTVLTLGLGSFGTINFLPTLGYGDYGVTPPPTPTPGGGSYGFRRRLRVKHRGDETNARLRDEISNRVELDTRSIDRVPLPNDPETVTYELDMGGVTQSEIDAEIARLLHKKIRTDEDEIILLLIMVAVIV